jgi:hypothetical protein
VRLNDKSKREKIEIRKTLRIRDGDVCQIDHCITGDKYREKYGRDFDVHHINENTSDWSWDNIVLAAHRCNVRETPHGKIDHRKNFTTLCNELKSRKMRCLLKYVQSEHGEPLKVRSAEYMKSTICKPLMDQELNRILDQKGEEEKNELIDSLSNASTLSPEVCRKWLRTYCNSNNGHLEEYDKDIGAGETMKYVRKRE